jgi:hypothetical protein
MKKKLILLLLPMFIFPVSSTNYCNTACRNVTNMLHWYPYMMTNYTYTNSSPFFIGKTLAQLSNI